eukprot:359160-Chlamydomonas_euryale.AAC.2
MRTCSTNWRCGQHAEVLGWGGSSGQSVEGTLTKVSVEPDDLVPSCCVRESRGEAPGAKPPAAGLINTWRT